MFCFKILAIFLLFTHSVLCAPALNCSSHQKTDQHFNSPARIQHKPSSAVFSAAVSVAEAVVNGSVTAAPATPLVTGRPVKTAVSLQMIGPESVVKISDDDDDDGTDEKRPSISPYDYLEQIILRFVKQQKKAGQSTGLILQGISRSVHKATESYLQAEEMLLMERSQQQSKHFGWYESA